MLACFFVFFTVVLWVGREGKSERRRERKRGEIRQIEGVYKS